MSPSISGFAFDGPCSSGQTDIGDSDLRIYRPDGLPAWTLNRTVRGAGDFRDQGQRLTTQPGDLVLIAPHAANDYGAATQAGHWTHQWAVFEPPTTWTDLLQWPAVWSGTGHLQLRDGELADQIANAMATLVADGGGVHPSRRELALGQVHRVLVLASALNPRAPRGRRDQRLAAAMAWANQRLGDPIAIDDLAATAGLSPSRFAHLFREQIGEAPRTWLERRRVGLARELLIMTGEPIAHIARRVGIADPSYFARVFSRHTGMTPRAWRDRRR